MRATKFEFELVFGLPEGDYDSYELSDAVFQAGFEDAVIGTGNPCLIEVDIKAEGNDAEAVMAAAANAIMKNLPAGTEFREARLC